MEQAHRDLLLACLRGQREQALALLDLHPALLNAAWAGDAFGVDELFWVPPGDTTLTTAAAGGDGELVLALLERGASTDGRDENGSTALLSAAAFGQIATTTVLLDKGIDLHAVDNGGQTSLHMAAQFDRPAVCELLLSRGIDLLATDSQGLTALEVYGWWADPPITEEAKEQALARLRAAWEAGPHPSQVQRRRDVRWARRWPFVRVLVCYDFQPTAARKAMLALLHPPLPPSAVIPPLPNRTRAQRYALLRNKVLTHPGLWKLVASFL